MRTPKEKTIIESFGTLDNSVLASDRSVDDGRQQQQQQQQQQHSGWNSGSRRRGPALAPGLALPAGALQLAGGFGPLRNHQWQEAAPLRNNLRGLLWCCMYCTVPMYQYIGSFWGLSYCSHPAVPRIAHLTLPHSKICNPFGFEVNVCMYSFFF